MVYYIRQRVIWRYKQFTRLFPKYLFVVLKAISVVKMTLVSSTNIELFMLKF